MTAAAGRILVVDDEVDIRTILALALRRAGYDVGVARDGIEAIEAVRQQLPDLMLLDVMMPRADGLETLRRVRADPATANLPVIMLTAKAMIADKITAFERGADDYVAKPFHPTELLARVQSLLRRASLARVDSPLMGSLGSWFSAERLAQLGRDLETARDIQARLLPPVPPTLAGLEAGALVMPSAMVGGDFFDVFSMRDRIGVVVGDVSGKGIPAALLMVMVRTLLREIARELSDPAEALTRLNASLCRDMPPSMFVTMVLGVLDPAREGALVIANGGHPPPIIMRRGARPASLPVGGMLVGAFEQASFDQIEVELAAGDTLLLLTDGVVEAQDEMGRRPGREALFQFLEQAGERDATDLARAIADSVRDGRGAGAQDDLTVFVLKR